MNPMRSARRITSCNHIIPHRLMNPPKIAGTSPLPVTVEALDGTLREELSGLAEELVRKSPLFVGTSDPNQ